MRHTVWFLTHGNFYFEALISRQWLQIKYLLFFSNTVQDFNCVTKEDLIKFTWEPIHIRATKLTIGVAKGLIYTGKSTPTQTG